MFSMCYFGNKTERRKSLLETNTILVARIIYMNQKRKYQYYATKTKLAS